MELNVEQLYQGILGSIYWKNLDGVYMGANDYAAKMVGLKKPSDLIGKTDYDLFPKEIADKFRENDLRVINENQNFFIEETVISPDGKQLVQLSSKRPLLDAEQKIIGVIGNTIDITYLKKIELELRKSKEAAEKMLEEKAQILRNMEHDIKTPFSGIYSIAGFLEEMETDPVKLEFIKTIKDCSFELLNYCLKFIEFARIEDGLTSIHHQKFDLKLVAEKVITMESSVAKDKRFPLTLEYAENVPKYFISDPDRIQKLLMNLIGNSVKFTEKGFVKLTIKHLKNDKTDKKAIMQFIIEDTGIGIPTEHQNFIYEKMVKVTPSNHNKYRGSAGLGLSMVKILVEDLEGQIEFKSELGKGTTFICTLPLELSLSDEPPIDVLPAREADLRGRLPKKQDKSED